MGNRTDLVKVPLLTIPAVPKALQDLPKRLAGLLEGYAKDDPVSVTYSTVQEAYKARMEFNKRIDKEILNALPCTSKQFQERGYSVDEFDNATKRLKGKGLIFCYGRRWYSSKSRL